MGAPAPAPTYGELMGSHLRSCAVAGMALALSGCSFVVTPDRPSVAPTTPSAASASPAAIGLRAATKPERIALSQLGLLPLDEPAFAYDLPKGRSLVGAQITYEGSPQRQHPGMLVTYAGKFALVSCDWDGSDALGVSVGNEGQQGIAALTAVLGDQLCQPWITASGR